MDKKTKIFFASFFALIAIVVTITFSKYFILKDYYIAAQADCDPLSEACFVSTCDPATDDTCSKDPVEDTSYYKLVTKKAYDIPLCDPADENCQALKCLPGQDCKEEFCAEATKPEGEECNDPVKYNEENPPATDESGDSTGDQACDPADATCKADADENSGDNAGEKAAPDKFDSSSDASDATNSAAN